MGWLLIIVLCAGIIGGYFALGEEMRHEYGPVISNWEGCWALVRIYAALLKGFDASEKMNRSIEAEWSLRPGYRKRNRLEEAEAARAIGPQSGRALGNQIGTWPKVAHAGGGYLIEASFSTPRRAKWPNRLGVVTAILLFVWIAPNIRILWPGHQDVESLTLVGVIIGCMIAGWASKLIWIPACRKHLKIKVENGGATWTGRRWRRHRILPGEDYEGVARQHHLAGEEIRVQAENIRIRATGEKEKTLPAYQIASEVIFRTGARKHIEWPVAEIMPDIGGRKAAALAAALDLAIEANRKAMEEAEARRKATAGGAGRGAVDLDRE